jgi:hypothetical protein
MDDRIESLLKATLPNLNVHITVFKLAAVVQSTSFATVSNKSELEARHLAPSLSEQWSTSLDESRNFDGIFDGTRQYSTDGFDRA